jgi:hypothetical protein
VTNNGAIIKEKSKGSSTEIDGDRTDELCTCLFNHDRIGRKLVPLFIFKKYF